jgi:hypothetical protein
VALDNVQSTPEIATALATFGIAEARLQEGTELLAQARTLHADQVRERGEQHQATEALNRAWDEADETYSVHRRLVRLVFRDDLRKLDVLGLSGSRKRSLSGWLGQATVFYTNLVADAEALAALGRYNVTQEAIEAGKGLVDTVAQLNSAQKREKYEAQQATKDRDRAGHAQRVDGRVSRDRPHRPGRPSAAVGGAPTRRDPITLSPWRYLGDPKAPKVWADKAVGGKNSPRPFGSVEFAQDVAPPLSLTGTGSGGGSGAAFVCARVAVGYNWGGQSFPHKQMGGQTSI